MQTTRDHFAQETPAAMPVPPPSSAPICPLHDVVIGLICGAGQWVKPGTAVAYWECGHCPALPPSRFKAGATEKFQRPFRPTQAPAPD